MPIFEVITKTLHTTKHYVEAWESNEIDTDTLVACDAEEELVEIVGEPVIDFYSWTDEEIKEMDSD